MASCISVNAQNYKKEGNTYIKSSNSSKSERQTGFLYKDSKGNEFPIYIGNSGSCYIKKISKKTGKEYRQYLGEEISKDICKSLGVEYKKSSK